MKKELTSAEAAALIYGKPGTKVVDKNGDAVWVGASGSLWRTNRNHGRHFVDGAALEHCHGPFTLPADPDELPEDVLKILDDGRVINSGLHIALATLWKHIKPEAKR